MYENIPWERVHRLANMLLKGEKIYLKPGEKPPKGLEVKRGPKGGLYYESEVEISPKIERIPKKLISEEKLQSLSEAERINLVPKATQEVLHALINDASIDVRIKVVKKIDQEGLRQMIKDKSHWVRDYIPSRIDKKDLHLLMDDNNDGIRFDVVKKIDKKGLQHMLADKDLSVGEYAVKRLYEMDAILDVINDPRPRARFNIALSVNPKDAKLLFNDSNDETRKFAASMARTSDLHKLLHDTSVKVREIVADRAPQKTLHQMIHDSDDSIRKKVVARIDETGLKEMENDANSEIANIAKSKLKEDIPYDKIISDYNKTGVFKLPKSLSTKIKNLSKHEKFRIEIQNFVDNVFEHANLKNLHITFRDSWQEMDGKDDRAGEYFLKDSVDRQYGGKKKPDPEMDSYYTEYDTDRKTVDKYVKLHKSISKAYLDLQYPTTDEITLYRGTSKFETAGKKETKLKNVVIKSSPMSAWTAFKEVANNYPMHDVGIMLEAKIKKDDIWANFLSWGNDGTAPDQREFLVISTKDRPGSIIGKTEGLYGEHTVDFGEDMPEFEE